MKWLIDDDIFLEFDSIDIENEGVTGNEEKSFFLWFLFYKY